MAHVTVIAEAGLNHGGQLYKARKLADLAKEAGADIVKFQTYDVQKLLRKDDPDYNLLGQLALSKYQFETLFTHCKDIGIEFMSTPGDVDSLKFLVSLGVKRIKIGSDDLTNRTLLEAAAGTGLPVILSTGMATLTEIWRALHIMQYPRNLTLLHCVSLYPCPVSQANLLAIPALRRAFPDMPVGYSDHTKTDFVVSAAVALGAEMIEAHIMLDDTPGVVDYAVSYPPEAFINLVDQIRWMEQALGSGRKVPSDAEAAMIPKLRKGADGLRGEACASLA